MHLKLVLVILTVSTISCEEIIAETLPEANQKTDQNVVVNKLEESDKTGGNIITNIVDNIVSNLEKILPSENDINETPNANESTDVNETQEKKICKPNAGGDPVELLNGTQLIKILLTDPNVTKETPGECILILFYAKICSFSSMAAPHFNALARAFPDVKMAAIDSMKYHIFNAQNGIVGVPTLVFFYNGRPIAKYNETEYTLDLFSKFVTQRTGLQPIEKSYVTSADFAGPVPSTPEKETDYFLGLSWLFIIFCAVYYFSKSRWWKWIVETIQNTWRESEAQHEHND